MKQVWVVLLSVLTLSACAYQRLPYPRAVYGPDMEQTKLQSASHWDLLAKNESEHIAQALPSYATVHVVPADDESTSFHRVYHDLLLSSLVKDGATVMLDDSDAIYQVEYRVETVTHHRRDRQRLLPGTATAFWLGGKTLYNARNWSNPELVLLPIAVGVDVWNMMSPLGAEEATEVVITTRVHNRNRFVMADSRVYYFSPQNIHHYQEGRRFPVVGATTL